jgi:hypothetical protein
MMPGTTFQWWRAFLYLGVLTAFRGYIADYVEPWVNQANDLLGGKLKADDAALFICIPLLMGVLIKPDEILAYLITIILRELKWPLVILIWLLIVSLAMVQQNGACAPFNTLWDAVSCNPRAVQWLDDLTQPFADRVGPWVQSVHWISWIIWSIGMVPILALKIVIELLLFVLAMLSLGWLIERVSDIVRSLFRYIDRRRNPEKYICLSKGDWICIECEKCDRRSQYHIDDGLIQMNGPYIKLSDWLTRDCPRRWGDIFTGDACGARWWVQEGIGAPTTKMRSED